MIPPYALKNRSLLSLDDLSARDVELLLEIACDIKRDATAGREHQWLRGLHIATLAANDAARPGDPLEAAATQQGAIVVRIGPQAAQSANGHGHELPGLLGRLYDAIEVRGMTRPRLRDFASRCRVPVYRDLGHAAHPARVIADLMSMQEQAGQALGRSTLTWLGGARSERGQALMHGAVLMGAAVRISTAGQRRPGGAWLAHLQRLAQARGARVSLHDSDDDALLGCDFHCNDRQAKPLRSEPTEPAAPRFDGKGRAEPDGNRLHAVKALLVATLA